MKIDGRDVHAYVVILEGGQLFGLDERPLHELEVEWLARWRESGVRRAPPAGRAPRGAVLDARIAKRVVEDASEYADVGEKDVEGLSAVEFVTPSVGEVFRLKGIPTRGGAGSLSHLACEVQGITCAPDGPSILAGFLAGTVKPKKARRGK